MDVVNVVIFYLAIISDTTNDFLPGNNKDLLNWIYERVREQGCGGGREETGKKEKKKWIW